MPGIAVRLPILIQYQSSGANQPEATVGAVSSLVGDIVTRVGNVSWKRAVELLHWIEELNAVDTIAIPDAEDNGPSGTKAVPAPLQPGRQDDEEAPQAMGASMFLLGTGLLLNTAKQRRRERIRFSSLLEA